MSQLKQNIKKYPVIIQGTYGTDIDNILSKQNKNYVLINEVDALNIDRLIDFINLEQLDFMILPQKIEIHQLLERMEFRHYIILPNENKTSKTKEIKVENALEGEQPEKGVDAEKNIILAKELSKIDIKKDSYEIKSSGYLVDIFEQCDFTNFSEIFDVAARDTIEIPPMTFGLSFL